MQHCVFVCAFIVFILHRLNSVSAFLFSHVSLLTEAADIAIASISIFSLSSFNRKYPWPVALMFGFVYAMILFPVETAPVFSLVVFLS